MNKYYITAEIAEEMPSYDFVVKAKTATEAHKIAKKIITHDYPDYRFDYTLVEVTPKLLIDLMTIN